MPDPSIPLLRGIWSDILSHRDTIPADQRVKVLADLAPESLESEPDAAEEERLALLDRIFAEVDTLECEPSAGPIPPYGEAVVEKYRRQGWKLWS